MRNSISTPPPPPPPPKDYHVLELKERSKYDRYNRTNLNYDNHKIDRSKSYDNRNDETPHKYKPNNSLSHSPSSYKSSIDSRTISDRVYKKKLSVECDVLFASLPNIDKYAVDYSAVITDFTVGFYGHTLEKQVSISCLFIYTFSPSWDFLL